MIKKIMIGALFVFGGFMLNAQELTVKSDAVKVDFLADMQKTKGSVSGFEAKINFNMEDLSASSITGTVDVNTLSTGNSKRDEHLKSADYFEAEKFPVMSFTSSSIVKEGDQYIMKGKVKIRDTEREEMITFTYSEKMFSGELIIQASNYLDAYAKKSPDKTDVVITFAVPVM